jgi:DNA-binding NarL/FixJ family response regulator
MKQARILLADDHWLTLAGIRTVLEPNYEVTGAVTDGRALVESALRTKPDLIVTDIAMPLLNGIDAATQIKKQVPTVKVIFLTMHVNSAYLHAALAAGATGYVLKSAVGDELLEAVEAVLAGRTYVTSALSGSPNQDPLASLPPRQASPRLSPRERETLKMIAEGKASKEIAHILNISIKTVNFHRENLRHKLGVRTTAELTRHAIEQGLV